MDDLGWSYHLFLETSITSRYLDDFFEASWLKPRVSCHFPSKPKVPVSPNRWTSLHVAGGIWQPTWSIGSTKKNSEIECLNDLDGPLVDKAMLFLSVANIAHDLHNLCVYTLHRNKISRTFEANPVSRQPAKLFACPKSQHFVGDWLLLVLNISLNISQEPF